MGVASPINLLAVLYMAVAFWQAFWYEKIRIHALVGSAVLYFAYFMTSLSWSAFPGHSMWYAYLLCASFGVFLAASLHTYTDTEKRLMLTAVYASAILLIGIVLLKLGKASMTSRFSLDLGSYMDPNYFTVCFCVITALLLNRVVKKRQVLLNCAILLSLLFIIFLTGSRGGLIANLVVCVLVFLFSNVPVRTKVVVLFAAGIATALFLLFFLDHVPQKVLSRFTYQELLSTGGAGRSLIWQRALGFYQRQGLFRVLFGIGLSNFAMLGIGVSTSNAPAHNIVIQSLLEGGIVGLLLTANLFFQAFRTAFRGGNTIAVCALAGLLAGAMTVDMHIDRTLWFCLFLCLLTLPAHASCRVEAVR